MFEKVNKFHPDKVADRVAGAIVDLAYQGVEGGLEEGNPRIAVEVLLGHGKCVCIVETSLSRQELRLKDIEKAVKRIAGDVRPEVLLVGQDKNLSANQQNGLRCGDNGIFRGLPTSYEQKRLAGLSWQLCSLFKSDGKYIIDGDDLIICQSKAQEQEIAKAVKLSADLEGNQFNKVTINPLGYWDGGTDVDTGAVNRKLGSDMGDAVTGGGLHGKDLSKADVSVNIVCHLMAQNVGERVEACCAIGDEKIIFRWPDGTMEYMPYSEVVDRARDFIIEKCDGSFEKFAEEGLIV